jgi:hypothetical protein
LGVNEILEAVTPPSPFVSPEAVVGMAVYAILHGKGHDVWEVAVENIPTIPSGRDRKTGFSHGQ